MSEKNIKGNKKPDIVRSFEYALRGVFYALKTQRNMRIHMILAVLVLTVSLFLRLSRFDMGLVVIAISVVLITELINTACELTVDMVSGKHKPAAKRVKDLSAGAVFFSSVCAGALGYLVFFTRGSFEALEKSIVIQRISEYPPHIAAVVLFVIIVFSVLLKVFKEKNFNIRGGMPSIHTAVAFSLSAMIYIVSANIYVFILSFFLASMVGQTRVSAGIHSIWQVAAGALIGLAATVWIFQLIL